MGEEQSLGEGKAVERARRSLAAQVVASRMAKATMWQTRIAPHARYLAAIGLLVAITTHAAENVLRAAGSHMAKVAMRQTNRASHARYLAAIGLLVAIMTHAAENVLRAAASYMAKVATRHTRMMVKVKAKDGSHDVC